MCHLKNNQHNKTITNYLKSYLKKNPPDCILYSEDGSGFKIHKELLGQTKFMREVLKSANCCQEIEIIFPCSAEELGKIFDFIKDGKISCANKTESNRILMNFQKILGFQMEHDFANNFSSFNPTNENFTDVIEEYEHVEIISESDEINDSKDHSAHENFKGDLSMLDGKDHAVQKSDENDTKNESLEITSDEINDTKDQNALEKSKGQLSMLDEKDQVVESFDETDTKNDSVEIISDDNTSLIDTNEDIVNFDQDESENSVYNEDSNNKSVDVKHKIESNDLLQG